MNNWYVCKNEILIHSKGIMKQTLIDGPMSKDQAIDKANKLVKTKNPSEHYTIIEYVVGI